MGKAHRAEFGQRGTGIADDEHVAGLALGVGVPGRITVRVLDVVAQAFLSQQPGDEGEVALAAEHSRGECGRRDGCSYSLMTRPGHGTLTSYSPPDDAGVKHQGRSAV